MYDMEIVLSFYQKHPYWYAELGTHQQNLEGLQNNCTSFEINYFRGWKIATLSVVLCQ